MTFLSHPDESPTASRAARREPGHRWLRDAVAKCSGVAALTGAAVLAAGAAWAPVAGAALPAGCAHNHDGTVTCSYADTGSEQQFTVPMGVTALSVQAVGAPGAPGLTGAVVRAAGGLPASVRTVMPSTPGQTLFIEVGGPGNDSTGGYNGGANGGHDGGGGGGATDIRTCSVTAASCPDADSTFDSRLLVAGGGGGGGTGGSGTAGAGGGAGQTGSAGGDGTGGITGDGHGGGGGTSTDGGSAGTGYAGIGISQSGTAGNGGAGGNDPSGAYNTTPLGGGGGGGGGYFGGGGGGSADVYIRVNPNGYTVIPGAAGGGGGGSSYSTAANAAFDTAPAGHAPSVSITYTPAVPSISSISPATLGAGARTIPVTVTGSNFDYPVKVKFSNPGIITKVNPSTPTALHLTVTVQQGTIAGPYTLSVTGADGQVARCTGCLNVCPGPSIQEFVPGSVAPGQKTTFTASGYGFTSDAKLDWTRGRELLGPEGVERRLDDHRHGVSFQDGAGGSERDRLGHGWPAG